MERCTPLAIVNAQLVNEGECYNGAVLIDSTGRIAQVIRGGAPVPTSGYRVMDAGGAYLFPGVIDTHVHFREPGLTQKGDIHTESAAAVAGGVTSFLDMPNTKPPATDRATLQEKKRLANGRAYANYGFYLGASTDNLEEIKRVDSREIPAVKLFMGSSTGSLQVTDPAVLEQIFAQSPLPIAVHCETDAIIAKNLAEAKAKWGDEIPFTEHVAIRCSQGCLQSTRLAIGLALTHNAHLHILHISSKEEVEELQRLANTDAAGHVTAETCLNYLWFCNDDLSRLTWQLKCNPAIKYKEDRQALRTALRQGVFSTIGTDHAPHLEVEKKQNYALSPSGIPSIQYAFVGLLEVAEQENIPLPRVVELTGSCGKGGKSLQRGVVAHLRALRLVALPRRKFPQPRENYHSRGDSRVPAGSSIRKTLRAAPYIPFNLLALCRYALCQIRESNPGSRGVAPLPVGPEGL